MAAIFRAVSGEIYVHGQILSRTGEPFPAVGSVNAFAAMKYCSFITREYLDNAPDSEKKSPENFGDISCMDFDVKPDWTQRKIVMPATGIGV